MRHNLVFVVAACAPMLAAAQQSHVTAGGVRIDLPEISAMECDEIRQVLRQIDASGYRNGGPDSAAPADAPLLDYENRLSERYFRECVRSESLTAPAAALARASD